MTAASQLDEGVAAVVLYVRLILPLVPNLLYSPVVAVDSVAVVFTCGGYHVKSTFMLIKLLLKKAAAVAAGGTVTASAIANFVVAEASAVHKVFEPKGTVDPHAEWEVHGKSRKTNAATKLSSYEKIVSKANNIKTIDNKMQYQHKFSP